jgi:hypothetical protein
MVKGGRSALDWSGMEEEEEEEKEEEELKIV